MPGRYLWVINVERETPIHRVDPELTAGRDKRGNFSDANSSLAESFETPAFFSRGSVTIQCFVAEDDAAFARRSPTENIQMQSRYCKDEM